MDTNIAAALIGQGMVILIWFGALEMRVRRNTKDIDKTGEKIEMAEQNIVKGFSDMKEELTKVRESLASLTGYLRRTE
jgi:hypothetical protein